MVVSPTASLAGRLRPPGDKSVSHRALMFGAICRGRTRISHLLDSADVRSTRDVLTALGVTFEDGERGDLVVVGRGSAGFDEPKTDLDCANSGTTMRLLCGLLVGQGASGRLVGDASLSTRPMNRVVRPLTIMGATVKTLGDGGRAPLLIANTTTPKGIVYRSPIASAQVKSCVLLASLRSHEGATIIEPAPSRDHTERLLRYLGYQVDSSGNYESASSGEARVVLSAAPNFTPDARPISVPADISSAAFWLAAAGQFQSEAVVLEAVSTNPTRTGVLDVLAKMGVTVMRQNARILDGGEPVADLSLRFGEHLLPTVIDGSLIPRLIDEIPVLAVLSAAADGTTYFRDVGELRVKETDRLAATIRLLEAANIPCDHTRDSLSVHGPARPKAFVFDSEDDHRMAMAAAVLALRADGPCEIRNADACSVSYRTFFTDLALLAGGQA